MSETTKGQTTTKFNQSHRYKYFWNNWISFECSKLSCDFTYKIVQIPVEKSPAIWFTKVVKKTFSLPLDKNAIHILVTRAQHHHHAHNQLPSLLSWLSHASWLNVYKIYKWINAYSFMVVVLCIFSHWGLVYKISTFYFVNGHVYVYLYLIYPSIFPSIHLSFLHSKTLIRSDD